MTITRRNQQAAIAAAVLFAVAAGYDLWHLVTGSPFGSLARSLSILVALGSVLLWSGAAILLVVRPSTSGRWMQASFGLSLAGAFLVLAHGLVLRGAEMLRAGIVFLIAAPIVAILIKLAWTPFPWARREPPAEPARTLVRTRRGDRQPAI